MSMLYFVVMEFYSDVIIMACFNQLNKYVINDAYDFDYIVDVRLGNQKVCIGEGDEIVSLACERPMILRSPLHGVFYYIIYMHV